MSTLMKAFFISLGIWIGLLATLLIFPHWLPSITGFARIISLPIAFALFVLSLFALFKDKNKAIPILAIIFLVLIVWIVRTRSIAWGAKIHFYLNKGKYEAMVARILSANDETQRGKLCEDECWLISNSPLRVGFHYAHEFLNWHDIVYDPSRAVETKDIDERHKLNVYFIDAEHITGDWYLGHFGD